MYFTNIFIFLMPANLLLSSKLSLIAFSCLSIWSKRNLFLVIPKCTHTQSKQTKLHRKKPCRLRKKTFNLYEQREHINYIWNSLLWLTRKPTHQKHQIECVQNVSYEFDTEAAWIRWFCIARHIALRLWMPLIWWRLMSPNALIASVTHLIMSCMYLSVRPIHYWLKLRTEGERKRSDWFHLHFLIWSIHNRINQKKKNHSKMKTKTNKVNQWTTIKEYSTVLLLLLLMVLWFMGSNFLKTIKYQVGNTYTYKH